MPETRDKLAELCRDHAIGIELIEQSCDLEQVLDRTLAECERRVGGAGAGADADDRLRQLSGLLRLAQTTRHLQSQGATLEEARDVDRALRRVDREIDDASARTEQLRSRLDAAMTRLEAATADPPFDLEALRELFQSLSRLCHKINNPLTSVMGRAQMLQLKVHPGQDAQLARSITVIEESARRVADLVQELAGLVCQGRKEFVESYDSSAGSR
jgi:signal transduction histidine kinase